MCVLFLSEIIPLSRGGKSNGRLHRDSRKLLSGQLMIATAKSVERREVRSTLSGIRKAVYCEFSHRDGMLFVPGTIRANYLLRVFVFDRGAEPSQNEIYEGSNLQTGFAKRAGTTCSKILEMKWLITTSNGLSKNYQFRKKQ